MRLRAMSSAVEDPRRWLALNNEFHLVLYAASGRTNLCRLIHDLMRQNLLISEGKMIYLKKNTIDQFREEV